MANTLKKYGVAGIQAPTDIKSFGWDDFTGLVKKGADWIENIMPQEIAKDFVEEVVSGEGEGLGSDIAEVITDPLTGRGDKEDAYDEAESTLEQQMININAGYNQAAEMAAKGRDAIAELIGPEYMQKYGKIAMNMRPGDFVREPTNLQDFAFNRDVSQFLDPNADYVIDQSVKAAQQAMSGQGGMMGGAAARALQAEASQKAGELYGDAFDRMMKATEQEYGKERDIALVEQDIAKQMADREKNRMDYLGNLGGMYVGNLQGKNEDLINLLMARMGTNLSLAQAMAQLGIDKASQPTNLQTLLGMGGDVANIYKAFAG